jgi:hypothetical protein
MVDGFSGSGTTQRRRADSVHVKTGEPGVRTIADLHELADLVERTGAEADLCVRWSVGPRGQRDRAVHPGWPAGTRSRSTALGVPRDECWRGPDNERLVQCREPIA